MKLALVLLVVSWSLIAVAQSDSGAALRNSGTDYARVCGPTAQGQPSPYAGACNVWLTGVMDGLQAYNSNLSALPLFDAPDVTVGQIAKLVVKFVADHPDKANLPAAAVVLGTLVENFPRKDVAAPVK